MTQYYSHLCACGCGDQIEIKKWHKYDGIPKYVHGHNKSNLKHGDRGNGEKKKRTRLYTIYHRMKNRCNNSKNTYYGGRGITICNEWLGEEGYRVFKDWALSHGYADNLEIDRRNTNGNYEPSNCRFVTHKQNCQNRRPKSKKTT